MTPEHAKEAQEKQILVTVKTASALQRPAIITMVHGDRADVYAPAYGMQKVLCMSVSTEDISYIPIHWDPAYIRFLYHVFGLAPPENRPTRESFGKFMERVRKTHSSSPAGPVMSPIEGGRAAASPQQKPDRSHLRLIRGGKE